MLAEAPDFDSIKKILSNVGIINEIYILRIFQFITAFKENKSKLFLV